MTNNKLKTLDIGHSRKSIEDATILLETTISEALYKDKIKVIKVITGHGSGKLRKIVRQWCNEQEGRFQAVIYGEEYNMFNKRASDMRYECNIKNDSDYGRENSGVTYIWLW